jgi:23S rRNA U2552 (ribose-2'-O)-methylase RlmE/FtsJ
MCYIKYYNQNKNNKLIIKYYKYKDIYYRKAKEDGFRARSAYKLI